MSTKESRMITATRPAGLPTSPVAKNEPATASPPAACDAIDSATHLWALRLWMLCALIIVAFAVCNYLLHLFMR